MSASGVAATALAGCGGTPPTGSGFNSPHPGAPGLDAVIDISNNVTVTNMAAVRRSNILAVFHKCSEGGDWFDPAYATRRVEAERAGLLWGAYHFGTRQYSGVEQANAFLAAARPGPKTLLALDLEPNERNPRNTMQLAQAEAFVQTVYQATGRYPLLYTHPTWANGIPYGRRRLSLDRPITPQSVAARCDLWLAHYREEPEIPYAWANRGWRLWQYVADQDASHAAYGSDSRTVAGVSHCDRNYFAGSESELFRYWRNGPRTT